MIVALGVRLGHAHFSLLCVHSLIRRGSLTLHSSGFCSCECSALVIACCCAALAWSTLRGNIVGLRFLHVGLLCLHSFLACCSLHFPGLCSCPHPALTATPWRGTALAYCGLQGNVASCRCLSLALPSLHSFFGHCSFHFSGLRSRSSFAVTLLGFCSFLRSCCLNSSGLGPCACSSLVFVTGGAALDGCGASRLVL